MTLLGARVPRLRWVPPYLRTRGPEAVDLATMAGLILDPWQRDVLDDVCALSNDDPDMWNTLENGIIVPRQNGKGGDIEAYVLACLFLWDDAMILYSAHRFDTSQKMFKRIRDLIVNCPSLNRRVRRVYEGNGKESIHLKSGAELAFHTRSASAGRGFTGNKIILDEAFKLESSMMGALMPTMSAVRNPQITYWSSAGWEISTQLGQVRRRAMAALMSRLLGEEGLDLEQAAAALGICTEDAERYQRRASLDDGLAFLEWSVPEVTQRVRAVMSDPKLHAMANPAYGIRISPAFVLKELRAMGAIEFGRERLGIGDYPPDEDDDGWGVVTEADWVRLVYPDGVDVRPGRAGRRRAAFAVDMRPDRSKSCISAAYEDEDGQLVVEVIAHAAGSGWVVPRLLELRDKYEPCAIALDTVGPASSLIEECKNVELEVLELSTSDIAQAYGQMMDAITDTRHLRHLDQEPLTEAVKGAATRPLGVRKTWDRDGDTDISPLVAATNAVHAHIRNRDVETDPMENIW